MHYHYYAFPLLIMLDLFIKQTCNADGYMDLDIMYMSELDPTWNNDELAFSPTQKRRQWQTRLRRLHVLLMRSLRQQESHSSNFSGVQVLGNSISI